MDVSQFEGAQIPVLEEEYDVIIAGGGPAGVAAALAAARHNAKVLIIEKKEMLGGLATQGIVAYFAPLDDGNGYKVTRGIVEELFFLSVKYSYGTVQPFWAQPGAEFASDIAAAQAAPLRYFDSGMHGRCNTMFNVPAFALAMEDEVCKAGAAIRFDTAITDVVMDGNKCLGVIIEDYTGRRYIKGKTFVDATGYGTLFTRAGAEMVYSENKLTACAIETSFDYMQRGIDSEDMTKALHWTGWGYVPGGDESQRDRRYQANTAEDVTNYIMDTHKLLLEILKQKREQDESYCFAEIASQCSIRKARRIAGRQAIMEKDMLRYQRSSVGCVSDWRKCGPVFEVPYLSLFDANISNILAAGRIIASEGDVWDVTRTYNGAMLTGQAAGTAAALACSADVAPDALNIKELQKTLAADNVLLHYEVQAMH